MGGFKARFWRAFLGVTAILLVPLVLWSRIGAADLPAKPEFPVPGKRFVAEYAGQGAYIAHLAYWWGLFGFGDRIRQADIVLIGSSHTQFGLSARQLSADLSQRAGRPIRVFNAGLGCDTPLGFDASLLDRLDIRNRLVVADGFAYGFDPYTYGCFSEFSGIGDRVQALFKALGVATRFDWDWMLDGVLPRIDLSGPRVTIGRYLNQPATILDWHYGDVAALFSPEQGEQFPVQFSGQAKDIASGLPWRLRSGTVPVPDAFKGLVESRHIRLIMTLVPFLLTPGFNEDRYENVERLLASDGVGPRAGFIAIPPGGLQSFDSQHLTGAGRAAATKRLAAGLASSAALK